jgi:hypothetical protein
MTNHAAPAMSCSTPTTRTPTHETDCRWQPRVEPPNPGRSRRLLLGRFYERIAVDLRQVSRPFLTQLCEVVNENTYLAVRRGNTVTYADGYEAGQNLSIPIWKRRCWSQMSSNS